MAGIVLEDGCHRLLDIMHPGREVEVGIDLIWQYCESDIPGAAVCNALCDGENINGHCLSVMRPERRIRDRSARTPKW
jgi:hypothetical protein